MTSTSPERVVLRGAGRDDGDAVVLGAVGVGELRTGTWTRLGGTGVLGDPVTEATLDALAERARTAGHAQGYAAGWAEAKRLSADTAQQVATVTRAELDAERRRRAEQHASLVDGLTRAAEQLHAAVQERHDELAEQALDLALAIAAAVLGRELAVAADPGREALERAVRAVGAPGPVTVRLHPDDVATLDADALTGRDVTVLADPTLARGDAVAVTDGTVVDATVAGALARVREVLGR